MAFIKSIISFIRIISDSLRIVSPNPVPQSEGFIADATEVSIGALMEHRFWFVFNMNNFCKSFHTKMLPPLF